MPHVVWLSDPAATKAELVGPKAARLAAMARAGLPVPSAFCLTTEASLEQLCAAGLEAAALELAEVVRQDGDWKPLASRLRAALAMGAIAEATESTLQRAFAELSASGQESVAVRSSAPVESDPGPSYTGIFSSFLGVLSFEQFMASVRACWASRWSPRAITYAQRLGAGLGDIRMALVIQKMVEAESAGIALTSTPAAAGRDSIVVNGAWGLGRAVAEAEIVPDFWRLERPSLAISERRTGYKPIEARVAPGGGEVWQRLAHERASMLCMDDATLGRLARLLLRVERLLDGPQEVEWALAGGQLWLLQARLVARQARSSRTPGPRQTTAPLVEGQPTSGGRAAGRARLVARPQDLALLKPDEILVTSFMRPSMTALLPRIAGLVIEAGGTTAHTASLARERRIPAIMAAIGATRLIPDGAVVTLDADEGKVWLNDDG